MHYFQDVHAYNLGFLNNVRQALGRKWVLTFFSPFISSPLESDGLSYHTKGSEPVAETTKTL